MRAAPTFPPARDRQGAWSQGPGAQRVQHVGTRVDFGATGARIAGEGEGLTHLLVSNTTAALTFFQVFFRRREEIVLGTTRPDYVLAVADGTSGALEFDTPLSCPQGAWVFATTTRTGSTGAGAGHDANAAVVTEGLVGDDAPALAVPGAARARSSSPRSSGYR